MFDLKTKILVADDMTTMRKIICKVLKELGYQDIVEAADGTQAWEAIQKAESPFGLIISDWNMPNCSGLDLLKRVKSSTQYKKIPFVLVTAEAEKSQVAEAVKAGVDQYVVKPFSRDDLRAKLMSVYKRYSTAA